MMPPLVLLAGGLATRLYPLTRTIPKSMLEVAGEPFIAHQLRLLREQGIQNIVICAGHLGEQIAEYVGDGSAFGVQVSYSFDGSVLLGTGGALRKALPHLAAEDFFIMYGDSYLDTDFQVIYRQFRQQQAAGLMTVLRNGNKWDASNVLFLNNCIVRYDKKDRTSDMQHIDYGLGLLRKEVLETWPENSKFDLVEVYQALICEEKLAGFEVKKRFYEIGSEQGLAETTAYLQKKLTGDGQVE